MGNAESRVSNLSPVDWLMPRSYVCQILCFPTTTRGIFPVLKAALQRTVQDVPFLLEGVTDLNRPQGAVRLSGDSGEHLEDLLSYWDLTRVLDYAKLREKGFSPASLTVMGIRPPALKQPYPDPEPVFRARLLPVAGGALLFVAVHHSVTDITSVGTILKIWANHCRGGSSADLGFDPSWLDRGPLSALAKSVAPPPEPPALLQVSEPTPVATADYETRVFRFPPEALKALKTSANEQVSVTQALGVDWISTGDVLTALLWSASTWAEWQVEGEANGTGDAVAAAAADDTCVATVPVNIRSKVEPPLPEQYLGAAFSMAPIEVTRADLLALSSSADLLISPSNATAGRDAGATAAASTLARIAAKVRIAINSVTADAVRASLAYTLAQPDITAFQLTTGGGTLPFISWAAEGVYQLDWGQVLGRCEAVRLPNLVAKRYPLVLPRLPDGSHEAIVCFDKGTMERFASRLVKMGAV
ncbi:transferase family-domain-containing protein [Xylariales sp. PMI_506]|nr:transferase family-domain-containing protein [Xylariales sp. PMI_506]